MKGKKRKFEKINEKMNVLKLFKLHLVYIIAFSKILPITDLI